MKGGGFHDMPKRKSKVRKLITSNKGTKPREYEETLKWFK